MILNLIGSRLSFLKKKKLDINSSIFALNNSLTTKINKLDGTHDAKLNFN